MARVRHPLGPRTPRDRPQRQEHWGSLEPTARAFQLCLLFYNPIHLFCLLIFLFLQTNKQTYIIALHCTALHCATLHCYITLHYIKLHYITLHYIALHCITLHCITHVYVGVYIYILKFLYIYICICII